MGHGIYKMETERKVFSIPMMGPLTKFLPRCFENFGE